MAIRFPVAEVEPADLVLGTTDTRGALAGLLGAEEAALGIEACSAATLVEQPVEGWRWHPLIAAVHRAFTDHLPLELGPDALWLCIAQGVAGHLRATAGGRHASERDLLEVRHDGFRPGAPDNPWPEIFDGFVAQIGERRPDEHRLIMAALSTTGPVERAAFAVTLMDAMQDYFTYVGTSLCGIPSITLTGEPDDYRRIRERVGRLDGVGPDGWTAALAQVCDRLVAAAEGRPDRAFFQSLYKWDNFSGGPYMNGWINVLFPYQWSYRSERFDAESEACTTWAWPDLDEPFAGGKQKAMPLGVSRAPLVWRVLVPPAEYRYELLAGFVGVAQDPATRALRPELGWAVRRVA